MQFGTLLKLLHTNVYPSIARFSDSTPFRSMIWMDDLVIIEPNIGTRAKTSLGIAKTLVFKLFGKSTLNLVKDLMEGLLEPTKLTWGLIYNSILLNRRLPDPKLEKAAFLLMLPAFDWGNFNINFKLMQELRGCIEFWKSANPHLAPFCGFINAMLATPWPNGFVRPKGTLQEQARAFRIFWETIEFLRIMIVTQESWEIKFTHCLTSSLTIGEIMASPIFRNKVYHASGDATLEKYALVFWNHQEGGSGGKSLWANAKNTILLY